ncbi:MAG TPA: DUF3052 domain-containing protein [Rudaea sp.]|nr:DUF3052 domain-containing protein [Rudaea sp.]
MTAAVGYSGTPLWKKLGLTPGLRVWLRDAPDEYWRLCGFDAGDVEIVRATARAFDFGHVFATHRAELARALPASARKLVPTGTLWISWPKKSSGVTTDVTEDTLRELALPLGLVDVKVCAVTEIWSGLKFVWRRERRANVRTG